MAEENIEQAAPQPREERQMTVLINARIRVGDADGLCRIRNVSPSGLNIETSMRLDPDERATIILPSGRAMDCVVRWARDGRVGLGCHDDPAAIVHEERSAAPDDGGAPSLLRFTRNMPVQLVVHGFVHHCELESIAIRDVRLNAVRTTILPTQVLTVCVPGLGELPAAARSAADGTLFARFNAPIGFALLDPWLATRSGSSPRQAASA